MKVSLENSATGLLAAGVSLASIALGFFALPFVAMLGGYYEGGEQSIGPMLL